MADTEFKDNEKGFGARTAIVKVSAPLPIANPTKRRKIYQVGIDLSNEKKFMERVNGGSAFTAQKIRKNLYPCDIVLSVDRKIMGFVEFKNRPGALAYTDGVMISLDKAAKLAEFSDLTGVPIIFVIENAPGDYHAAHIEVSFGYEARLGGRRDRGDVADTEVVILVPRAKFKPLASFLTALRSEIQSTFEV